MANKHHTFGRGQSIRRINFREPIQRFLIVCEGSKTEPNYFNAFRVPKDIKAIDVRGIGYCSTSLVQEAIKLMGEGNYDQVWCVFDVDDNSVEDINRAITLASNNDIHVAYSNQAFEIWFLLHFNYYHTSLTRQQYKECLSKLLKHPYEKNCRFTYSELQSRQLDAIKNAKRLLGLYSSNDPARNDPSTNVHLLIEELNRFTPDSRK